MNSEVMYSIGDFCQDALSGVVAAENAPNYFFIGLGFVMVAYWIKLQVAYNKEAAANGTPE